MFSEWLSEAFDDNPTAASSLGLTQYDAELGDFSAGSFERRARAARQWARRLAQSSPPLGPVSDGPPGVGPNRAGPNRAEPNRAEPNRAEPARHRVVDQDRVDSALLASHLAGKDIMDDWQYWRRDPGTYLDPCLWGVAGLFLHHLRPEAELVEAAAARIRQIPAVLDRARPQLDPELASPVVLGRGVGAARGGAHFLTESLQRDISSPELRAVVAAPAAEAAVALRRFADHLSELAAAATGTFAIGEPRYSGLLRRRELLSAGAQELSAMGQETWDALDREMDELAAALDPSAPGWRAVRAALSARHPSTPQGMLDAYRAACDRARSFLVARELVSFPEGEQCLIEPSPEFLRPVISVASYEAPPAFQPGRQGHFLVPFPPDGANAEQVEQLLADNSWSSVPTIAVHEAYPGHHWQLSWALACDRPLRKVITTSYFVEGWALYAEAMMRRQGFFQTGPEELAHLEARIFRAARVVVDTALHCGEMNFDDAVAYMLAHTSLTPTVAHAEVRRYCAWPTQAASYLVGALDLDRLRQRWQAEKRGTLREFHDQVAASPGLPLPLVAQVLFDGTGR